MTHVFWPGGALGAWHCARRRITLDPPRIYPSLRGPSVPKGMAADPWSLFAFRPSATATKAWWHRCKRCSRWDVSAEQMSGGFCERRVVMVRGVYGDSEARPVLRWVCLHDETHVWTDSELAEHWATWKAGMSELDGLVRKRGGAETELVPRAARKRPREDPSQQGDNVSPRACAHARRTAHARAPMRSHFSVPLPPEQVSIRMIGTDYLLCARACVRTPDSTHAHSHGRSPPSIIRWPINMYRSTCSSVRTRKHVTR